jgi:WhiB family transcriptional regulator, redox-sensing transcriptional regulator
VPGSFLVWLARQAQAIDDLLPCQREDARLWFSDRPADLEAARAHCQPCPLREQCLAGAIERSEPCGVWGGQIFAQGVIIPVKRPRGRPRATAAEAP